MREGPETVLQHFEVAGREGGRSRPDDGALQQLELQRSRQLSRILSLVFGQQGFQTLLGSVKEDRAGLFQPGGRTETLVPLGYGDFAKGGWD